MIIITENFETIKSINQLKDNLLEIIRNKQEEYWENIDYLIKTEDEVGEILNKFLTEITIEQIDEYIIWHDVRDMNVKEAILCYLNECYFWRVKI